MSNPGEPLQVPPDLTDYLNRGDCVLFVGDALEAGGNPQARLTAALVDVCQAHCPFCLEFGKCQRPDACTVALTAAAQQYESQRNRHALVDFVRRFLEAQTMLRPGPIYQALAALPVRIVVTTAYDDGLEHAFKTAGRRVLPVINNTDVPFDDPGRVQLIYLHGALSQPESLVLTEDDAVDLFARLPTVTNILRGHFASKTLFFVGYGLVNPAFQMLYRQVTAPIARLQRMAYALQWPPNPRASERWRNKITVLAAEPLPFLQQLAPLLPVPPKPPPTLPLPPEPYKFLDYFTYADAAIFFGRDLEADLLLSTILAHPLTVFYGRSGTGKTSLLLAKVLPLLAANGYPVAYARLLGEPTNEVKAAVRQVPVDRLTYTDRGRRLVDVLADALPPGGRLVVVLDQFEEFFIRQGEAVRQAFAQELADSLNNRELNRDLRFVLSLRDDYLGALDELNAALPQDVFAHRYRIENLTRDQALLAIQKPAAAFGLPIDDNLIERLLADLFDKGLEPASLQIVLYQLYRDAVTAGHWSEREKQGAGLTLARYQTLGETRGILAGYLDAVLQELPTDEERQQAQAILKSMVTAERTKAALSGRAIVRGDLLARLGVDSGDVDVLLAYLRQKRVVRKFGDEERYELAHDVLVEKVWAWVNAEELRLLDVRDLLRRELANYAKFGHLLAREKLVLLDPCRQALALDVPELELLLCSALAAAFEVVYCFGRAQVGGVDVDVLVVRDLENANFRTRAAAVSAAGQLGARYVEKLMARLADDYPQVRMAAIHALERVQLSGDWRQYLKYECYVAAGRFIMGDDKGRGDEKPAHAVHLDAYYIGKYPVTNAEYKRYMDDRRRPFDLPADKDDHPVVSLSWFDASDYAEWAGMRLPSEAEWEKAASGEIARQGDKEQGRKRVYPWGDQFDPKKCNSKESGVGGTTAVGAYSPQGDSAYSVADMAGNVEEWCADWYAKFHYAKYYYDKSPAENPSGPADGHTRVAARGGGYWNDKGGVRCCACDGLFNPRNQLAARGVRVCASPLPLISE